MWSRLFSLALMTMAVAVFTISVARAADEVHEGKVTAVGNGKITILDDRDDENDTFIVTAETKITRNGRPAKLGDIHAGDKAKVTATSQGEMLIAKEISAAAPE
jgi:hypothetical protein